MLEGDKIIYSHCDLALFGSSAFFSCCPINFRVEEEDVLLTGP